MEESGIKGFQMIEKSVCIVTVYINVAKTNLANEKYESLIAQIMLKH